jgi:adenylate cyclase
MEEFLTELIQDIKHIFEYDIETTQAYVVPSRHDQNLTFPLGQAKKGKLLETCVLMIDIRNSTKLSRHLKKDKVKLGKIYSAFIYAMTTIADEYGYVRNIVGDRVMVVFEPKDCFVNAINCAALMYTVATRILAKIVAIEDFKIGIGIDYGEMLVLKTGIRKKHEEQSEYKSLVWVGDVANTASKLCDFANKAYSSPLFKITYEHIDFEDKLVGFKESPNTSLLDLYLGEPKQIPIYERKLVIRPSTVSLNQSDFAIKVTNSADGWKYDGKKLIGFSIENRAGTSSPILMSGKIVAEFKKLEPKSPYLAKLASKDYPDKPYTGTGVYGGSLLIPEANSIKF